jgi:hypothetical protein
MTFAHLRSRRRGRLPFVDGGHARASLFPDLGPHGGDWLMRLASGEQNAHPDKREYEASWNVRHGLTGKGDGPIAGWSEIGVSGLARPAKRRNGAFPFVRVCECFDATRAAKPHRMHELPIWGFDAGLRGAEYYMGIPCDPEAYLHAPIPTSIGHVYRAQAR